VRHTGNAHYGAGTSHGDDMFENGGFIVHFFDRALVDRLAAGFTLLDLTAFEECSLPRRRSGSRCAKAPSPPVTAASGERAATKTSHDLAAKAPS
jgi:hypothetical protein